MLGRMHSKVWLNTESQFAPGKELFRSERSFSVWAYALSHSQLLLRTRTPTSDRGRDSRIDILFKPVDAMKIRMDYDGLILRCATTGERERILAETGCTADHRRVSSSSLGRVSTTSSRWPSAGLRTSRRTATPARLPPSPGPPTPRDSYRSSSDTGDWFAPFPSDLADESFRRCSASRQLSLSARIGVPVTETEHGSRLPTAASSVSDAPANGA
jgi:hypothetical protein